MPTSSKPEAINLTAVEALGKQFLAILEEFIAQCGPSFDAEQHAAIKDMILDFKCSLDDVEDAILELKTPD